MAENIAERFFNKKTFSLLLYEEKDEKVSCVDMSCNVLEHSNRLRADSTGIASTFLILTLLMSKSVIICIFYGSQRLEGSEGSFVCVLRGWCQSLGVFIEATLI